MDHCISSVPLASMINADGNILNVNRSLSCADQNTKDYDKNNNCFAMDKKYSKNPHQLAFTRTATCYHQNANGDVSVNTDETLCDDAPAYLFQSDPVDDVNLTELPFCTPDNINVSPADCHFDGPQKLSKADFLTDAACTSCMPACNAGYDSKGTMKDGKCEKCKTFPCTVYIDGTQTVVPVFQYPSDAGPNPLNPNNKPMTPYVSSDDGKLRCMTLDNNTTLPGKGTYFSGTFTRTAGEEMDWKYDWFGTEVGNKGGPHSNGFKQLTAIPVTVNKGYEASVNKFCQYVTMNCAQHGQTKKLCNNMPSEANSSCSWDSDNEICTGTCSGFVARGALGILAGAYIRQGDIAPIT
jgi:hypothetical protein